MGNWSEVSRARGRTVPPLHRSIAVSSAHARLCECPALVWTLCISVLLTYLTLCINPNDIQLAQQCIWNLLKYSKTYFRFFFKKLVYPCLVCVHENLCLCAVFYRFFLRSVSVFDCIGLRVCVECTGNALVCVVLIRKWFSEKFCWNSYRWRCSYDERSIKKLVTPVCGQFCLFSVEV